MRTGSTSDLFSASPYFLLTSGDDFIIDADFGPTLQEDDIVFPLPTVSDKPDTNDLDFPFVPNSC